MYPVFVGVGNSPYVSPYVTSFVLFSNVASSPESNVIVYLIPDHFAFNVKFSNISTISVASILFSFVSYQPSKLYPSLVGVGNSPYASPYVTSFVLFSNVPSPGFNVIVYLFAVQCAYNVTSPSGIYSLSTFVPSFSSVYHPANVYPSLVGSVNSTAFLVYTAVIVSSFVPNVYVVPSKSVPSVFDHFSKFCVCSIVFVVSVPSLFFNVTVYPFGAVGVPTSVVLLYIPSTFCSSVLPFNSPPFGFIVNV